MSWECSPRPRNWRKWTLWQRSRSQPARTQRAQRLHPRFDMAEWKFVLPTWSGELLSRGSSVTRWSIYPPRWVLYCGHLWFYLRFVDKSIWRRKPKTISAQTVESRTLGLSGSLAKDHRRRVGSIGTVIGLPFLEDILKFILKKRNRQNKKNTTNITEIFY